MVDKIQTQSTDPRSLSDHIITIMKASLSSIPFAGGAAILLDEYIFKSTYRAISKAFKMLDERVQILEKRIDPSSTDEDQLADTTKSFLRIITNNSNQIKLMAAVNIVTNLLLSKDDHEKLIYNEIDHFTKCIDSLSVGSLEVFGVFYREGFKNQRDISKEAFITDLERVYQLNANMDYSLIFGLLEELNSKKLIHLPGNSAVKVPNYTNQRVETTILGYRFAKYILELEK